MKQDYVIDRKYAAYGGIMGDIRTIPGPIDEVLGDGYAGF